MISKVVFHEGESSKPLVVFIHGMGVDSRVWIEPERARILAGKYPLGVLLDDCGPNPATSFADLKSRGFNLLAWSQERPVGPIETAVSELRELVEAYGRFTGNGLIFLCHSKGGLIARKYLEFQGPSVRGLITLATPHRGTIMARWASYISPLSVPANRLLAGFGESEVDSTLRRILGFLASSGLRELLPDSALLKGLKDAKVEGARYASAGGTSPDLLRAVSLSLPEIVSTLLPEMIVPEEMREGSGDGLVSASSSVLPCTDGHMNFHVNHGSILCDPDVRRYVLKWVDSM